MIFLYFATCSSYLLYFLEGRLILAIEPNGHHRWIDVFLSGDRISRQWARWSDDFRKLVASACDLPIIELDDVQFERPMCVEEK